MATINLTDFSSQQAELERRARMADLLQQQAFAPIEVQSSRTGPAPIAWSQALAKVLQGYWAGKENRDINKAKTEEKQAELQQRLEAIKALTAPTQNDFSNTPQTTAGIHLDAPPSGMAAMLQRMAPGQALAPQPAMSTPPPQAPPMAPPAAALAAAQPPGPMNPVGPTPDVQPMQLATTHDRPTTDTERQAMALQMASSTDPTLQAMGTHFYDAASKKADQAEELSRMSAALDKLPLGTEQRTMVRQLLPVIGPEGVTKVVLEGMKPPEATAMMKDYTQAKSEGYQGSFVDFMQFASPKFISTSPGQPLYNARDPALGVPQAADPNAPSRGAIIDSLPPNARITDLDRTPAENKAVNGVANSKSLIHGQHLDFTLGNPQADMAYVAQLNANTPGWKAIYEGVGAPHSTGPHIHMEKIGAAPAGAPKPVAVGPQRPGGSSQWSLTPQEQAAINQGVGEGRADAKGLNSRTAKITAGILLANPGINLMQNHAIANLMANAPLQQKIMLAQALPTVLENVRDAGQKLKFSDVQYVGKLQGWMKGQFNDPDFRNYMTQRNDAMLSIANVMRGIGMSDKTVELELEAAPITMSPKAWDAWYTAQIESLRPRLDRLDPLAARPGTAPNLPPPPAKPTTPGRPPTGVDPKLWNHMTPQERALWK